MTSLAGFLRTRRRKCVGSPDHFKLKTLEKMGVYLKSPVQLRKIPADFWRMIGRMKVDYLRHADTPKAPMSADEERLEKLTKLKGKNKLTKKKSRELLDLSRKIKKKRETEKGEEKDRRLRREVQRELAESDAIGDAKAHNNLKRQIILKVFYIVLRVVRSYVAEEAFEAILEVLFVYMPKADSDFCGEVLRELQGAYRSVEETEANGDAKNAAQNDALLQKKMLILNAITRLSNEHRLLTRNEFGRRKHVHHHLLLQLRGESPAVAGRAGAAAELSGGDPPGPHRKPAFPEEDF